MFKINKKKFKVFDKIDKTYFNTIRDLKFDKEGNLISLSGDEYKENNMVKSIKWRNADEIVISYFI